MEKIVDNYRDNCGCVERKLIYMRDVVGDYINSIIAEKDKIIAEIAAEKKTNFVTYLIENNKTNEEIKKIVPTVDDEFINSIRKAIKR